MPNGAEALAGKGWRRLAVLAIPTLVLGIAHPVFGAQAITGTGTGSGWAYPDGFIVQDCSLGIPLTGLLQGEQIVLDHVGTYTGTNPSGTALAVYAGPTRVTINVGQHATSPAGVGPSCATQIGPVPMTATVTGGSGGGSVSCSGSGNYARVGSAVTVAFTGPCTLVGNTPPGSATVHGAVTAHVITGSTSPCTGPFVVDAACAANPDAGWHLVTSYVAAAATP
jgi:hypothetical protein